MTVSANASFAYVVNTGSNTVEAYTINSSNGVLTVVGTAVATGSSPWAVALSP